MSTRLLGNQQVSLSFVGTVIHTSQGGQLGLFLPCLLTHLYPAEHGSLTKVSSRARSAPEQADCPHTWLTSRLGPLAIVYTIIPSCLSHARFNLLFILILICSTSEISLYCSWSKCLRYVCIWRQFGRGDGVLNWFCLASEIRYLEATSYPSSIEPVKYNCKGTSCCE